jgi:hypothetical protein
MQRPWPLANANGFILVWESLTGVISVRLLLIPRGSRGSPLNGGDLHDRYKFVTVSLLERLRNGRFTSETAVRRHKKRNDHLDPDPEVA